LRQHGLAVHCSPRDSHRSRRGHGRGTGLGGHAPTRSLLRLKVADGLLQELMGQGLLSLGGLLGWALIGLLWPLPLLVLQLLLRGLHLLLLLFLCHWACQLLRRL